MFVSRESPAQKANEAAPEGAGQTKVLVAGSLLHSYQPLLSMQRRNGKGVSGQNSSRGQLAYRETCAPARAAERNRTVAGVNNFML